MSSIENFNTASPILPSPPASLRSDPLEKPLVSRYSIIYQILVYPFVAIALMFMVKTLGDWDAFLFFSFFFLLFMIPVWFVSAVVRVNSSGITMLRLYGVYRRELEWNEIESIKPGPAGVGIKLRTVDGRSMAVSSQMSMYPAIVEILRTLRPDLFSLPDTSAGSKTFKKGFFRKSWLLFLSLATTLIFLASIPTIVPAIIMGIMIFFMWSAALNAVHTVTLEGNRLTAKSLRKMHEMTAQQIRDIRIATHYSRRGTATRLIQVELLDGTDIALTGFPEGVEIMYGFLKNWWSACQNA